MGAKTSLLVFAESNPREALMARPELDRTATQALAQKLFPGETLPLLGQSDLWVTYPPDGELHIACFRGVTVIADRQIGIDSPSKLPQKWISAGGTGRIYFHAMHSVVDWFAFAIWSNGTLIRALSLSPDTGIIVDIGERLPFELPYWSGQHPVVVDRNANEYPFPFHPLDLGEAALKDMLGFQIEGPVDESELAPESIMLLRYQHRRKPWWAFWR